MIDIACNSLRHVQRISRSVSGREEWAEDSNLEYVQQVIEASI